MNKKKKPTVADLQDEIALLKREVGLLATRVVVLESRPVYMPPVPKDEPWYRNPIVWWTKSNGI